jgi:hypothetical protein
MYKLGETLNKSDYLKNATIGEILTQYNAKCYNKSWNESLSETYSQELLERILSDATFSIMTVWRSMKDWLENPYMLVQLGFEEEYPIIDNQGESVYLDDPLVAYYVLNNDQLSEENQRTLIYKFLTETVNITVQIKDNDRIDNISFTSSDTEDTISIPLKVSCKPDLYLIYMMLDNIQKKNYEIIDLYGRYKEEEEYFYSPEVHVEVMPLPLPEDLLSKGKTNYPELWKKIHMTALKCTDMMQYGRWIWEICKNLPCSECKWHMIQYIVNTPPAISDNDNTAFYWSWQFHNEVNKRLDKPEYPYNEALNYYSNLF